MGRWLVLAALIPACYRPSIEAPCTASCEVFGEVGACPGEQVCGTDLRCHAISDDECSSQPDAPGEVCLGHAFLKVCFVPADDLPLGEGTINTDSDGRCRADLEANLPGVCVMAGRNVTVLGNVQLTGTRPFALVASGTLTVEGTLDGASHAIGIGPGADTPSASCAKATTPTSGGAAGSGGFGGSFQNVGGNGGKGGAGGSGGIASPFVSVDLVHSLSGPCKSSSGSDGSGGNAGAGGAGGGAVALLASSLTITSIGIVNVSGAGGSGGRPDNGGGGGGGAGGMVLLDADSISVQGIVLANGGGGGGGAGAGTLADGAAGSEPALIFPFTGPQGGSGGPMGGKGGSGGGSDVTNGSIGVLSAANGGGGGGGGIGYILMSPQVASGMMSPVPIAISQ
jgi:hypothetical protein